MSSYGKDNGWLFFAENSAMSTEQIPVKFR